MDDTIIISIFMGLEGVHAYSAFLPSVFTIQTFVRTEDGRRMIRQGEAYATLFLGSMAVVTSYIAKSMWPLVFGLVAGAGMLLVYEKALRESPAEVGMNSQADSSYEDELDWGVQG